MGFSAGGKRRFKIRLGLERFLFLPSLLVFPFAKPVGVEGLGKAPEDPMVGFDNRIALGPGVAVTRCRLRA